MELDAYAGPLEELVDAAERCKLDIDAILLSEVCAQYEAYAASLQPNDLTARVAPVPLAARLAQMKSRKLMGFDPAPEPKRLERDDDKVAAIRAAADKLDARERKGRDVFGNGRRRRRPDGTVVSVRTDTDLRSIFEGIVGRNVTRHEPKREVVEDDDAIGMLRAAIGPEWADIADIAAVSSLPFGPAFAALLRAALAEVVEGRCALHQDGPLAPLMVRRP